jgi:hypothetical protein
MLPLLASFAPHVSRRVWPHAVVLVLGTILAPGRRTVAAALRVMGLDRGRRFARYHRVLSRDRWSGLAVGRTLLSLLVAAFVRDGPLLIGIDETIERRRGPKITTKGIYRDAVRSSHTHFVKASGLRWVCLMLLVPIPWAGRTWALPFLTALAPSERYDRERGQRHKTLTDWAGQLLLVVRPRDPAHDAGAAGPVLTGDAARPSAHGRRRLRPPSRLVPQAPPHLRGRARRGPAASVAAGDFLHLPRRSRCRKSATRGGGALDRGALLRCLNGQSRA